MIDFGNWVDENYVVPLDEPTPEEQKTEEA